MAIQQIQYPAKTQPVGDPSDWVEPVFVADWSQPTSQPTRPVEYRYELQSVFYQGEPDDFVEPFFLDAWVQPQSQPVLTHPSQRHTYPSTFLQLEPDTLVEPAFMDAWVQPTSQPVYPIEYRFTLPSMFVQIDPDDFIEPVFFDGWTQPFPQPVYPVEFRYTFPSTFYQGEPDDFVDPDIFSTFGWERQTHQPILKHPSRIHTYPSAFFEFEPSDFVNPVFFDGWVQPFPQPVRPIEFRYTFQSTFYRGEPDDFAPAFDTFGWEQATNQRLVVRIEKRYLMPSVFYRGEPDDFIEPGDFDTFGWEQPTSQRLVVRVEKRYLMPSVFYQDEPRVFSPFGWEQATNQGLILLPETRHLMPSMFVQIEPAEFVEPVFFDGWVQPISQPVYPIEYRYLIPSEFIPAFETIISTDSGVFFEAWVQPVNQPVYPVEYRYLIPWAFVQIEPDDFDEIVIPGDPATFIEDPARPFTPGHILSNAELNQLLGVQQEILSDTCDIQRNEQQRDKQGGVTDSWRTISQDTACRISARSGSERFLGDQRQSDSMWQLTLASAQEIFVSDRVLIDSVIYEVTFVNEGRSFETVKRVMLRLLG